jgi:large subunit ribosomal protein L3
MGMEQGKFSRFKGEEIFIPVTIVECPPIRIAGIRLYKKDSYGNSIPGKDVIVSTHKDLARKIIMSKNTKTLDVDVKQYHDLSLLVFTQPKLTGLKKIPELFELRMSGTKEEKLSFAKAHIDKEIKADQVFKEGQFLDAHAITTGKGYQGPVKRFGIDIRRHKAEKTKRGPGSIGIWHRRWGMFRVPHAGQTGYQQRMDLNKQLLKFSTGQDVNPEGGIISYGLVKNSCMLIRGSLSGPKKRMIIFTKAQRKPEEVKDVPTITYISTSSKQGR